MHVALCAVLDPSTVPGGYTFEKMRAFLDSRVPLVKEFHRVVAEVPVPAEPPGVGRRPRLRRRAPRAPGRARRPRRRAPAGRVRGRDGRAAPRPQPSPLGVLGGRGPGGRSHRPVREGPPLRPRRRGGRRPHARLLRHRARSAARRAHRHRAGAPARRPRAAVERGGRPGPLAPVAPSAPSAASAVRCARSPPAAPRPTPPAAPRSPAPITPFNGAITSRRAISFGRLSLAEVKAVGRASGATVNDVLLATCAQAFRAYLLLVDALPAAPLVAGVPVGVREERGQLETGNRLSVMFVPLHTEIEDPVACLEATVRDSAAAKREHAILGERHPAAAGRAGRPARPPVRHRRLLPHRPRRPPSPADQRHRLERDGPAVPHLPRRAPRPSGSTRWARSSRAPA